METPTLVRILEFFVGVFSGIGVFGAVLCFIFLKDFNFLFSLIISTTFFGVFSFFAIVARVLGVLLKRDDSRFI